MNFPVIQLGGLVRLIVNEKTHMHNTHGRLSAPHKHKYHIQENVAVPQNLMRFRIKMIDDHLNTTAMNFPVLQLGVQGEFIIKFVVGDNTKLVWCVATIPRRKKYKTVRKFKVYDWFVISCTNAYPVPRRGGWMAHIHINSPALRCWVNTYQPKIIVHINLVGDNINQGGGSETSSAFD
ncbi:MAG: hypothetical protein ACI8ZN_002462 [Bacteroidia bacterium]|jgi:hypothetical protein